MTKKEFTIFKQYAQAMVDEASARGLCEHKGQNYLLVTIDDINKLFDRIKVLIKNK